MNDLSVEKKGRTTSMRDGQGVDCLKQVKDWFWSEVLAESTRKGLGGTQKRVMGGQVQGPAENHAAEKTDG